MGVFLIVLMVIFFIYLIFCIELYLSWRVSRENRHERRLIPHCDFKSEVINQLELVKLHQSPSPSQLKKIYLLLKKEVYFDLFNEVIIEYYEISDYRPAIQQYINYFEPLIMRLMNKNGHRNDLLKLKFASLVGYYQFNSPQCFVFLLDCIKQNSIYLKLKALTSLSRIGEVNPFYEALDYIAREPFFYNEKFLIDIIGQFNGDKHTLNGRLLHSFDEFDKDFQLVLIHYFTIEHWQEVEPLLIGLLANEQGDKELYLGAVKYFINYPNIKAKSFLLNGLSHVYWEYRALCARALQHFPQSEVIEQLFLASQDRNWYVRYHSATTLCSYNIDEQILSYIEQTSDQYSKDILSYVLALKNV